VKRPVNYAELPFEDLLAAFEPLLWRLAGSYHQLFPCHDQEDYYQLGSIGLWKAHERIRHQETQLPPERFPVLVKALARMEILLWLGKTNFLIRLPADVLWRRHSGAGLDKMNQGRQQGTGRG
jgi:hypothetical protein